MGFLLETRSVLVPTPLAAGPCCQQADHPFQIVMIEGGRRLRPHQRFGVNGDAKAGNAHHLEIVGAIADGQSLGGSNAVLLSKLQQHLGLDAGIDDAPAHLAG